MARPLKPMPKWCQSVIQSGNESPKKRQKVAASFVGPVKQDENGKDFRELSIQKCIPFITARPDWQRLVTDILRDVIKHKAPDADERAKVDTWAPYDQAGFDEWLASLPPPVPDAASAGGKPATNKVKAGTAPKATTSAAVPERSKKRPTPPSDGSEEGDRPPAKKTRATTKGAARKGKETSSKAGDDGDPPPAKKTRATTKGAARKGNETSSEADDDSMEGDHESRVQSKPQRRKRPVAPSSKEDDSSMAMIIGRRVLKKLKDLGIDTKDEEATKQHLQQCLTRLEDAQGTSTNHLAKIQKLRTTTEKLALEADELSKELITLERAVREEGNGNAHARQVLIILMDKMGYTRSQIAE